MYQTLHILIFIIQIIFSDENFFNLDGLDSFNSTGEICGRKNVISPEKISLVELLLYGELSVAEDLFHFIKINSNKTHIYCHFLKNVVEKKYTFQLDNASIHISSPTSQWFSANHIEVLKWSGCLTDLNPTEIL